MQPKNYRLLKQRSQPEKN